MLKFHVIGEFERGSVLTQWVPDSRPRIPEIEAAIEQAWQTAAKRPNVHLFDGPLCRLENASVIPSPCTQGEGRVRVLPPTNQIQNPHPSPLPEYMERGKEASPTLSLTISRTSYKTFLGTNLTHPEFAEQYGFNFLANPIGLSAALQTADGFIVLGRRNARVAYYPSRVHPFAGALEPRDPLDVFDEMQRELHEELSLAPEDITQITCLGLAEDISVRQPELIFRVICTKTRAQIESRLDAAEHVAALAIATNPASIESMLNDPSLTPIAIASLMLWGGRQWGDAWFDDAKRLRSIP